MFHVAIFLLSHFCISIHMIQVQQFNYVLQGYLLEAFTALLSNMLWGFLLGFFFRVAIVCFLGWSALSDLLHCSTSNLTPQHFSHYFRWEGNYCKMLLWCCQHSILCLSFCIIIFMVWDFSLLPYGIVLPDPRVDADNGKPREYVLCSFFVFCFSFSALFLYWPQYCFFLAALEKPFWFVLSSYPKSLLLQSVEPH